MSSFQSVLNVAKDLLVTWDYELEEEMKVTSTSVTSNHLSVDIKLHCIGTEAFLTRKWFLGRCSFRQKKRSQNRHIENAFENVSPSSMR